MATAHRAPMTRTWQPSEAARDAAVQLGREPSAIQRLAERFRQAHLGVGAGKTDWDGHFLRWLQRQPVHVQTMRHDVEPGEVRVVIAPPTMAEPIPALVGSRGLAWMRSGLPHTVLPRLGEDERAEVARAVEAVLASVLPARPDEISRAFEQLAACWPRGAVRQPSEAVNAWQDVLADMPPDLLSDACRLWLHSPDNRFPLPGQLRAQVAHILAHRTALARRARDYLNAMAG